MDSDPIWLTEAEVVVLIDLGAAAGAVRAALALEHQGRAQTMEKTTVVWGDAHTLHALGGQADGAADGADGAGVGIVGTKTWAHTGAGATPMLVLWDSESGRLRAVVEAFALGQLRTAAVCAVATDLLADPVADVLALVGSGKQALAQAAAVASVRPLRRIQVHSPTPTNCDAFVDRLRVAGAAPEVQACPSVAEAVEGASVVTTVTRAREPFLHAAMLAPTAHVNAIGAISPERRELADDVASGAALVVADSPEAARRLSHELDGAPTVLSLGAVVAGDPAAAERRPALGTSVFKAMGVGLADVALGAELLERAGRAGAGRRIPAPVKVAPRFFEGGR